jgi:putative flavoprotein involved in K+ transport
LPQGNAAKTAGKEKTPMLDRTEDVSIAAKNWLAQFENAIAKADEPALKGLFHPESYWRDALALSWNLQTINGADAILEELKTHAGRAAPRGFAIDPGRAAPRRVTRAGTV